ncbi:hypothetical protein GCM10022403_036750 [Streptomyces coacervatus]|uniref:Transposase n=1 Tax=Streptomyces coacervatus TaxID=647381 RepID=A0ABP7HQJ8_9ACTN
MAQDEDLDVLVPVAHRQQTQHGGVRITDIYGERLTVDGTAVQPDVAQPTGVQFARH